VLRVSRLVACVPAAPLHVERAPGVSAAHAPQRDVLPAARARHARGDRGERLRGIPGSVFRALCSIIQRCFARLTSPEASESMLFPDLAYAAAGPPGGGTPSMLPPIILLASMFAIFYFLLLRPQQKQNQDPYPMLSPMNRCHRILT